MDKEAVKRVITPNGAKTLIKGVTEVLVVGDKMRSLRKDKRGISPIVATILLIAVTAVAAGVIAAYVAGLYVGGATIPLTATTSGTVIDWNTDVADNYNNGKVVCEATVLTASIRDVLDTRGILSISLTHHTRSWTTGSMSLTAAGKTTADYGQTMTMDGVLHIAGTAEAGDNLYIKVTVPTSTGGDITKGMTIRVDMWPTHTPARAMGSTISPAGYSGDNYMVNPALIGADNTFWNQLETIDFTILGRADALTLSGYDGVYLSGTTTT
jgi:flagellin-like protein